MMKEVFKQNESGKFESVANPQREMYSEKEPVDRNTVSISSNAPAGKSDFF